MENIENEVLLGKELYQEIVNGLISEVVRLKTEQGDSLTKIELEKETLVNLKTNIQDTKKKIKISKGILFDTRIRVWKINRELSKKNKSIVIINKSFINEGEDSLDKEKDYKDTIDALVSEIVSLKSKKCSSMSKISIEKETLVVLRNRLKQLKAENKESRNILFSEKTNLRNINRSLNENKNNIAILNDSFVSEQENYIDVEEFVVSPQPKRR